MKVRRSASDRGSKLAATTADDRETILLGIVGMSPAVITETVWALAFPPRGTPPIVPHRVRLITTSEGVRHLKRLSADTPQFEGRSPWEALRAAIATKLPEAAERLHLEDPRILSMRTSRGINAELPDIRTAAQNEAAADFILDAVHEITHRHDLRLVATLAGGRKTMGALLYAAMTLVAREDDLLTHVLVQEPFDAPLDPPFWFPAEPPAIHALRDRAGKVLSTASSASAGIELARVPFVPLRNRFHDLPEKARVGSFTRMIAQRSGELRADTESSLPRLHFLPVEKTICVDDLPIELENRGQVAFVRWLCAVRGAPWLQSQLPAVIEFFRAAHGFEPSIAAVDTAWRAELQALALAHRNTTPPPEAQRIDATQATRALSLIRVATRKAGSRWRLADRRGWELPACHVVEDGGTRRKRSS